MVYNFCPNYVVLFNLEYYYGNYCSWCLLFLTGRWSHGYSVHKYRNRSFLAIKLNFFFRFIPFYMCNLQTFFVNLNNFYSFSFNSSEMFSTILFIFLVSALIAFISSISWMNCLEFPGKIVVFLHHVWFWWKFNHRCWTG